MGDSADFLFQTHCCPLSSFWKLITDIDGRTSRTVRRLKIEALRGQEVGFAHRGALPLLRLRRGTPQKTKDEEGAKVEGSDLESLVLGVVSFRPGVAF